MRRFNNFTIQDEKGKSYVLLVQRAIHQALPSLKKRMHPLHNTITDTDDYKQFLAKLQGKPITDKGGAESGIEAKED